MFNIRLNFAENFLKIVASSNFFTFPNIKTVMHEHLEMFF